jgi:hypothetical protein
VTRALLAEFEEPEELARAVQALRLLGYRELETYSPFPVPGVEERLELPRPRLARYVFAGGVLGALLGYGIQWYADVWDYPQNVGGRPIHAVAAFIPVTFEAAILCAALVAFFGLLLALGLPRPWHPLFEIDGFDRATVDRFWIGIDARDPRFDRARSRAALLQLGPLRVVELPSEGVP